MFKFVSWEGKRLQITGHALWRFKKRNQLPHYWLHSAGWKKGVMEAFLRAELAGEQENGRIRLLDDSESGLRLVCLETKNRWVLKTCVPLMKN